MQSLRTSCDALQTHDTSSKVLSVHHRSNVELLLRNYLDDCQSHLEAIIVTLAQPAEGTTKFGQTIASYVEHSSRICPMFWLGCLRRERFDMLPES